MDEILFSCDAADGSLRIIKDDLEGDDCWESRDRGLLSAARRPVKWSSPDAKKGGCVMAPGGRSPCVILKRDG